MHCISSHHAGSGWLLGATFQRDPSGLLHRPCADLMVLPAASPNHWGGFFKAWGNFPVRLDGVSTSEETSPSFAEISPGFGETSSGIQETSPGLETASQPLRKFPQALGQHPPAPGKPAQASGQRPQPFRKLSQALRKPPQPSGKREKPPKNTKNSMKH